jgi:hypothetical protein
MVLEKAIWVFPVTTVGGPTRRLHVGYPVRIGSQHPEKCFGMHSACTYFNVVRLLKYAPSVTPVFLQLED